MSKNTREKIIDSMYDLIVDVGYEKASINKICSNVGVVKSSFYHFFSTKEEVLKILVERVYNFNFNYGLDLIYKTTNKKEYYDLIKELFEETIVNYENNVKERRFNAEIDLLIDRIPFIRENVNNVYKEPLDFFVSVFEHGKKINAISKNYEVKKNAEYIVTILIGINSIMLYDVPIEYKSLVNKIMEIIYEK